MLVAPGSPILPEQLKKWRTELCWTQADAADWLGYSERIYQKWEQPKAKRAIPKHRLAAIRRQMELAKARRRRA